MSQKRGRSFLSYNEGASKEKNRDPLIDQVFDRVYESILSGTIFRTC